MDFVRGQLVRSRAGRDKTRTYAVLAVEGQMLSLANGSSRQISRPKAKKIRHVAPTATVLQEEILATPSVKCLLVFNIALKDVDHC